MSGTEEEIAGKKTEWIELDWEELSKRILRTETDHGTDIALSLEQLNHDDHEHHDHDHHHTSIRHYNMAIFYSRMTHVASQFVRKWSQSSSLARKT